MKKKTLLFALLLTALFLAALPGAAAEETLTAGDYEYILLPDGTLQQGPVVVETDEEGRFLGWHLLEGEETFTEWVGGTYSGG